MERGGPFYRFGQQHATSSSGVNVFRSGNPSTNRAPAAPNNSSNNPNNVVADIVDQPAALQATVREQDQYMPIANVVRIMRRILPSHAKISDDAKETVQECVSEYISFITAEANERCQREQRKTVTAEDVLWAMGKLGFDNYVEPLTVYLNRYRENEGERSGQRGEGLLAGRHNVNMGYGHPHMMPPPLPPAAYGSGYNPVGTNPNYGMFDPMSTGGLPGFNRDGSGSYSGQNATANFDPFAQFKRDGI